jgi:cell shape-determining protein MreC
MNSAKKIKKKKKNNEEMNKLIKENMDLKKENNKSKPEINLTSPSFPSKNTQTPTTYYSLTSSTLTM